MMDAYWQNPTLIYVIYTGVALGVFLAFTGIAQMVSRSENHTEARSRRLKLIAKGRSTKELLAILNPPDRGSAFKRLPFIGNLPKDLRQAGLLIAPERFVIGCTVLSVVIAPVAAHYLDPLRGVVMGAVLGFGLPIAIVHHLRDRRTTALIAQLPDALDLMARGLRVGHPLNTSIGAVADEMADPIGTEFGIIFDQVSFGDDLTDAVAEFAERVDVEDVHYLSASIGIQHGTGGDLARVIAVLSQVIRNRILLRRKIQAISSEGRLTSWFLSALPVVIFTMTWVTTPSYYRAVMKDPLFIPMASAVVFFTVLNFLVLRKLVNFRI